MIKQTMTENWYIVKETADTPCKILTSQELTNLNANPVEQWGPFETKNQAIAKRVGLIRAGKCKPS